MLKREVTYSSEHHDDIVQTILTEVIEFFLLLVIKTSEQSDFTWAYFNEPNPVLRTNGSDTKNEVVRKTSLTAVPLGSSPVSLGPNHLAIVSDNKLYTCGLSKGGRYIPCSSIYSIVKIS